MTSNRSEKTDNFLNATNNPVYSGVVAAVGEIPFGEEHALVTRLSLDKQCYAVGLSSGSIKMYSISAEKVKLAYHLPPSDGDTLSCTDLQFVPFTESMPSEKKHILVASYASGHFRIWHYTGATPKSRLVATFREEKQHHPAEQTKSITGRDGKVILTQYNQLLTCAVSYNGSNCVTGGEDGVIRVYNLISRQEVSRCHSTYSANRVDGHLMRICSLLYHPKGASEEFYSHIFISGGWDDTIQIWDDRYSHSIWQYYGPHICGSDALDIDLEQNHIISCSWRRDKTILEVWKFNEDAIREFNEKKEVTKSSTIYEQYSRPISKSSQDKNYPTMGYVAKWVGNQYIVFGGSNANVLKIIDRGSFNTVGMVSDLPSGVYSVAYNIPENVSEKRPIRLSFCSGTKLFLIKLEKK